jgi:prevent-host-death family protein
VGAAAFKARCLELIDHVNESRVEYIVTRHGKPVARLGPIDDPTASGSPLNSMRGTLLKYDRPFAPIEASWCIDRDDDDRA